jgi:transposase
MVIALPDARQLSDEALEVLRLRALNGCELGFSQSDIADILGVARETVCRWWAAYVAGGVEGLPGERTGRPEGSGRSLTDEQGIHIQQLIDENSPKQLGIASPLWNRRAVRDLIKKEFDIDMPVRTVGEYLKRWGYTAKRPQRHSNKQNPEEVRQWLEEEYQEIEARAQQEDADILFADETGAAADEHPRYGYARQGERASMEVPDSHIRVNVVSTISNSGEVHYRTYDRTMNGAQFISFLEQLLNETDKKILLITDRLSAHDCEAVWEWIDQHGDRIDMEFLPRYSPEMNPVEYLNNDMKGNVHDAGLPNTLGELKEHVHAFLDKLRDFPKRVMSYFKHPSVQYAEGT